MAFQTDPLINLVIAGLIITGGLGFMVWFDLATQFDKKKKTSSEVPHQAGSLLDCRDLAVWDSIHTLYGVAQSGNDW